MRVGVSDAAKNLVVLEYQVEAPQVHPPRDHQQKEGKGEGKAAPGNQSVTVAISLKGARAGVGQQKETGDDTAQEAQRQQPAGDQLPRRQSEQVEVERLAEDRVQVSGCVRRIPVEGEYLPVRHHDASRGGGHEQRAAERDQTQDGFDRQLHG